MQAVSLTQNERDFLEEGGALWCIRPAGAGWKVLKLSMDAETVLPEIQENESAAIRLAFLLTDLAPPTVRVATHHSITRPLGVVSPKHARRTMSAFFQSYA